MDVQLPTSNKGQKVSTLCKRGHPWCRRQTVHHSGPIICLRFAVATALPSCNSRFANAGTGRRPGREPQERCDVPVSGVPLTTQCESQVAV